MRAAVVGAGAAGLVTAKELLSQGLSVVVFEQSNHVGGIWAYDPRTEEDDPLGVDPSRSRIHSSMYKSLRTNLPREVMGFREFPFLVRTRSVDQRRYPGHEEVQAYLEDFAAEFGLMNIVRLETRVVGVGKTGTKWSLTSQCRGDVKQVEEFEAVVVCNGHYTQPRVASIPGIEKWPGKQIHSHNYRTPEPFKDKVVVVIGNSSSGTDISAELSNVAKEVHLCGRTWDSALDLSELQKRSSICLHPMIVATNEDGRVSFQDGSSTIADIILHCTGYSYDFPFLDTEGLVSVDHNRVGPLYEHVYPPLQAPSLAFVGLPFHVAPFPLCELQAKWISMVLIGKVVLPSFEKMMQSVHDFYGKMDKEGAPKHKTHSMRTYQFEYCDWLADQCGCPKTEDWRRELYMISSRNRGSNPQGYRDFADPAEEEWLQAFKLDVFLLPGDQNFRKEHEKF